MINSMINPLIRFIISFILLQLLGLFKVTMIFGSQAAFFSGINIAVPMIGLFGGIGFTIQLLLFRLLIKLFFMSEIVFTPLIYHIPTIFASVYWTTPFKSIRLLIPMGCILLFNVHPVGFDATYYSWYWIIPIVAHFFADRFIFIKALGTTFTAHAVGSVLWLYWLPMSSHMFMALIPIVFIERLLFAAGMTILWRVSNWIINTNKSVLFSLFRRRMVA